MLKNIDPLLNAETLGALRAMGHSDYLIISDTNFPSYSVAKETYLGKPLRIDASAPRVAKAILSVMPLDSFVDHPAMCMEVVDKPDERPEVQVEVQTEIALIEREVKLKAVDRFKFYDMAKKAFCVITTAETRFYGCFMLQKGVIPPE